MDALYPFDKMHLNKEEYKQFSQIMKPYIRPRVGGVKKLEWYIEGFQRYIQDVNDKTGAGIQIAMEGLKGSRSYEEAAEKIRRQINAGLPVPYLMLRHKNVDKYKDFIWHWFLVVGYEDGPQEMYITVATYGQAVRMSLKELWDTGYEEKGGIILYSII